jgi:erythromycin esterase-like protein
MADQVEEIRHLARPLTSVDDLDPLLDRIAGARIVQIGEASHGTSDYYRWRAELTRRLIEEGRARFVAVEGDWPDCEAVTAWLVSDDDRPARRVLETFERWPTWMWANEELADFHELDVYSLWDSLRAVLEWLRSTNPMPSTSPSTSCAASTPTTRTRSGTPPRPASCPRPAKPTWWRSSSTFPARPARIAPAHWAPA